MGTDSFRHTVRNARVLQGLTQSELARRAGVGRQWLAGLESGRTANPGWQQVMAVLAILDLEISVQPRVQTAEPWRPNADLASTTPDQVLQRVREASPRSTAGPSDGGDESRIPGAHQNRTSPAWTPKPPGNERDTSPDLPSDVIADRSRQIAEAVLRKLQTSPVALDKSTEEALKKMTEPRTAARIEEVRRMIRSD